MNAARCPPVEMMGRGADARPGSAEGPSPSALPTARVDLAVQARKALSVRCPFDGEESAPRVPTLPSGLASFLPRNSPGHRKQKKSQGEPAEKPPGHVKPLTVWDETEEYFRPLSLADIDMLVPTVLLGLGSVDSCLTMPLIGNGAKHSKNVDKLDTASQLTSNSLPEKEQLLSEQQPEETEKIQAAENTHPAGEEGGAMPGTNAFLKRGENDDNSSLHWLLGSKERFVLTSERPNKHRKLLGGDAGLDRLLLLPHSSIGADVCDLCCLPEGRVKSNILLRCHSCKALVHQKCYGVQGVIEGNWTCAWCKHLETASKVSNEDGDNSSSRPCILCPKEGGAMKTVRMDPYLETSDCAPKFVHLFCSLWKPEVYVHNSDAMELVMKGGIDDKPRRLVCCVCRVKHGLCIRCSHGTCRTSFHPFCAKEAKYQMEIWGKFGCANVELRAFCSKHSSMQDMNSAKDPQNIMLDFDNNLLVAKHPTKKLPKLRFTHKSRDKAMMLGDASEKIDPMDHDVNAPFSRLISEGGQAGPIAEMDTDGVVEVGNIKRNAHDVAAILRKLIGLGKINADDVASEMGLSIDSLKAALVGETTSFSPGLRLKIIKWLQNCAHISALQPSRIKSSPVVLSDGIVTKVDTLNAFVGEKPSDDKVTDVRVESQSQGIITKSNTMLVNNDKALCSSGVASVLDSANEKRDDDVPVMGEDMNGRNCSDTNEGFNDLCSTKMQIMEANVEIEDSILSSDPKQGHEGSPLKLGTGDLPDAEYNTIDIEEKVSGLPNNGNQVEVDMVLPSKPYLEMGALQSLCSIHPLIKKKLLNMQNSLIFKENPIDQSFNATDENKLPTDPGDSSYPCCIDGNLEINREKLSQVSILELSPEDEVEGEIVYLQAKLLDNAVVIKNRYEDLLSKIVESLPHELNVSNKNKWDMILVNQFLSEVREAKKRGRKERKHKEAQAVLAAAAAAAAVSSRNSSLRKESVDVILASQEANAPTNRAGSNSASVSRAKDAVRSSTGKLSSDKQSMAFEMPDFLKDNALVCEICMRTETVLNRIFVCSSCKVAVHLDCYRRLGTPVGSWKCELCENTSQPSNSPKCETDGKDRYDVPQCGLCGRRSGALRKSADGNWVHAFCAEWLLDTSFRRGQTNLVDGMDTISKGIDTCSICHHNLGACLKCSFGHCKSTFHPSCASGAGFYMNAKATSGIIQHKAYCGKHSTEQREADNRQCGAEDLKSLKQIRVELEKLRLLCERIIKREKLKKELVLCSHDILASRRDCVAYTALVSSSFFRPGASSESATTSINNRSYSGTVQRSDEITVDSSVSGKGTVRLNNRDFDRNTDDSSTSQLSFKRKLADRESFAGKQLPNRSTSMSFRKSVGGENKAKAKRTETFQKELVMTSDQASMQNQRLPRGFVYVPVGSIPKEKALVQDLDPCEPRKPGG